ncbi:hypothetical protein EST38_g6501 [Candolleomyces aberdarensis]|uniref:Uncharacterized protein n=1 Tax=Candolleomyces aberdarensis TaxID=2316362 RepID=A0A4Q2DJJ3_9AGAR|nr:hypothetical protein EST38_g6501 [Candolleomyces aberdarensis]
MITLAISYIYIPLGGSKNVALNTLLVFTFVALWHDLTFRLLAWGWLVSLFILPELLATYMLPKSKYAKNAWYRHVCAIGAVANALMMMAANLLFGTAEGLRFLITACACLFVEKKRCDMGFIVVASGLSVFLFRFGFR